MRHIFCTLSAILCSLILHAQSYEITDSLAREALLAAENQNLIKAAELFETSAQAEMKCQEPRQKYIYYFIRNASSLYDELNLLDKAFELRKLSLDLCIKVFGKDHENYGLELGWVGSYYEQKEQYDKAHTLYLEALDNAEKFLGTDHSSYSITLNNLAGLYKSMGQHKKALPLYLKALENCEKTLGKGHSEYGIRLNNLAGLYASMGQYGKALPLYLEALENAENSLGKNHSDYGIRLNNLAFLYKKMGQYDKALPLYLKAVENCEKTLGKGHSEYGIRLNNLAEFYENIGQYQKALSLYVEALENTEKSLGKDHSEYGIRLNNLAGLYESLGQYNKALPLYIEALEICENSLGKEHPSYGIRLNNLAVFYESMGQYNKALPIYLEALENTEKSLGKDHFDYGIRLNNLAGLYKSSGQYDKAMPMYIEALENSEKALGKDHYSYGIRLNNLAGLYKNMGQYNEALPLYLEALENTEKHLGKGHPSYGNRLNNIALLYEKMGQYDKALPLYLEAKQNILLQSTQLFSFLSEKEKASFQKTVNYNFKVYNSFFSRYYSQKPEVSTHAYDIALATKGMILNSSIDMRKRIAESKDSNALSKFDEWVTLRNRLAKEYALPIKDRSANLPDLEEQTNLLERELNTLSNNFKKAEQLDEVSWGKVQDQLQEGEVAIEFTSFQFRNDKDWTDSILYCALVMGPKDKHPHLIQLFEQKELDSLLERKVTNDAGYVSALYRGAKRISNDQASNGKPLYDLIWKPIEKHLNGTETVYFSLSGGLHRIAFAALPINDQELLSDRYALHQLSSTAKLAIEKTPIEAKNIKDVALFGGIQYDLNQEEWMAKVGQNEIKNDDLAMRGAMDRASRGNSWDYLPGTLTEIEEIGKLLDRNNINYTPYNQSNALEENIKSLSGNNSPSVLHIATHGFFFEDVADESKDDLGESTKNVYNASKNPLHRAGLLFAGANAAWTGGAIPKGAEDGILSAYEASHIALNNTKLVVLSACETGLGEVQGSEGVFGLQRAFKGAGAKYLLMSLWKVPDAETAEFMNYFYENWLAGMHIRDAFFKSQDVMKKNHPDDPYKWAAFVMVR